MTGLRCSRLENETWREAVSRIAGKYRLEGKCLDVFDTLILTGENESQAAWAALYDWDCLEFVEGK